MVAATLKRTAEMTVIVGERQRGDQYSLCSLLPCFLACLLFTLDRDAERRRALRDTSNTTSMSGCRLYPHQSLDRYGDVSVSFGYQKRVYGRVYDGETSGHASGWGLGCLPSGPTANACPYLRRGARMGYRHGMVVYLYGIVNRRMAHATSKA